jgi:small subunit ribosomal protein S3
MISEGLEKRMPFRRVLKSTVEKVMAVREVIGIRVVVSGRLGGADMSRTEQIKRGRVPLQTFRANIDYAQHEANLPYGVLGIKVWIYLGETFSTDAQTAAVPRSAGATGVNTPAMSGPRTGGTSTAR